MSRISHFSRILLLLTLALLPRLAQAQRIGPLGPTDRQQSKALSTERTAAPRPPSLQLSLPSPAAVALPPLGPNDLQRLQPQEGRPPPHRRPPSVASGGGHAELLRGGGQDDRRGSVAIDRGRTPLASKRSVRRDGRALSAMGTGIYSQLPAGQSGLGGRPKTKPPAGDARGSCHSGRLLRSQPRRLGLGYGAPARPGPPQPLPYHCLSSHPAKTGHFYLATNRTCWVST